MRREFYPVFEDLYKRYLHGEAPDKGSLQALGWIGEEIDQAVADLGIGERIRPDARLFILVNLHQMIVSPLLKVREIPLEELRAMVAKDLQTSLRQALQGGGEISGHAVLNAVHHLWKHLELCPPWDDPY
jgi:hypothetical protein